VDGRAQPEFALAFGARRSDLPTALILSAHHRRFAALRGAFSESTIDALVNGVLSGKVKTASLQVAPRPIAPIRTPVIDCECRRMYKFYVHVFFRSLRPASEIN
jgi:hypothetical protein